MVDNEHIVQYEGKLRLDYFGIRQVIADYYKTDVKNVAIIDDILCDAWGVHTGLFVEVKNQKPKNEDGSTRLI